MPTWTTLPSILFVFVNNRTENSPIPHAYIAKKELMPKEKTHR
ncbi:hypothetical protein B4065_3617 [Caldibacillus thermoamylovorans]|nr:hypothetical protein B4065_3617 [Caldibacillus thermoamylovorans]